MDAAQALADLTEISSQIQAAVLFDEQGAVEGSTLADEEAARRLVAAARALLDGAGGFRSGGEVTQIEASTHEGSVFVVREGPRWVAATTGPEPTVGLVFYDLKSCLRGAATEPAPPKRRRRSAAGAEDGRDAREA